MYISRYPFVCNFVGPKTSDKDFLEKWQKSIMSTHYSYMIDPSLIILYFICCLSLARYFYEWHITRYVICICVVEIFSESENLKKKKKKNIATYHFVIIIGFNQLLIRKET